MLSHDKAARLTVGLTLALFAWGASQLVATGARADKDEAFKLLKAMSDYLTAQKTISATFDADIEVVTPELQKIQFTNSGQILLVRPDKFRGARVGGYADVELVFDGKTATLIGKHINAYTEIEMPGDTDRLFDRLRTEVGMQVPGADLLLSNVFVELTKDVIQANHIGEGVIGGIECEHLAFRNDETDWQLWIQKGSQPVPRKLVITSKTVAGAPQYTLVVREWKTDLTVAPDAFAFKEPAGAKKVKLEELADIDELPAGVAKGANK